MLHRYPRRILTLAIMTILCCCFVNSLTHAEEANSGELINIRDVTRGSLLFCIDQPGQFYPAPVLETNVEIDVTGLIARGVVVQRFTNPGTEWVEGVYVFPLSETAAVDHLRIIIGKRRIDGMIQERKQAQKTYSRAKNQGRRASLLEQERPNMFTASIANIGPGETVSIEIEYQETLRYNQGWFSLRFPLVVGPRYIPGTLLPVPKLHPGVNGNGWGANTNQVPDASRITPWVQNPDQGLINPVSIRINLLAGFPLTQLKSHYHPILITQNQEGGHTITLKEKNVPTDRDFELIWEPEMGAIPRAAVFTETKHGEKYALILVLPPKKNRPYLIRQSREVIFVIDTSGSMFGLSIEQAKAAVSQALNRFTARDRVNIIQFNSRTKTLFPFARAASQPTIQHATKYVGRLLAEGGTEMLPALRKALQQDEETSRLRQVIFITDGQIGNESEFFRTLQEQLQHSRLFTIGIGSAPNSYFMRKAAELGGGTFTYIGKINEVQERMDDFFQKLEHPAMSNIHIQASPTTFIEQVPERVPDLYLGEPVIFAMRTTHPPDTLTITGHAGPTPWEMKLSLKGAKERKGIAVHWARQKIESLMNHQIGGQHTDTIRQQIIDLAFQHHLVSRYTSLVAVDVTPVRSPAQRLHIHPMKTNLAHGQDYTAIFGLTQGGTSGPLHFIFGLFFLMVSYGLYRIIKNPA